jgi:S1-C subfamily serine protease
MTYEVAQAMGTQTTFGWLIVGVIDGSPAVAAGLRGATEEVEIYGHTMAIGGDIILAINGTQTINGDSISSYLEEFTSPGQTISLTVERDGFETTIVLELGTRP